MFSVFIFKICFRPNLPSPLPKKRARSGGEDATNSQNELLPLNEKNDDDSDDNDSSPADLGFFNTN